LLTAQHAFEVAQKDALMIEAETAVRALVADLTEVWNDG
jgi:hypothetical protein